MVSIKLLTICICLLGWCLSQTIIKPATEDDPFPIFELGPSETADEWLKQIQGILLPI